ncbi:MAG: tRNA (adenosine(37)-N6)-threonylcarbamoyltransferase complex ATPase subunit type 1 TsaE [Candidatus Zipacnadales bacterium]
MTRQIAASLARWLKARDVIALRGPLGAGKTCFVQGLALGLGIGEVVSSPSFVIAKHYKGSPNLLHVDAYRLSSEEDLWELGLEDEFQTSVAAIEWAQNVEAGLPEDRIEVTLQDEGGNVRVIELMITSAQHAELLERFTDELHAELQLEKDR